MNPVPVATSLVLICNVEEVLLSVPDEVFSSVPVEALAARKDKTIGAKRNHLNFTLPDISSTYIGRRLVIICYPVGISKVGGLRV